MELIALRRIIFIFFFDSLLLGGVINAQTARTTEKQIFINSIPEPISPPNLLIENGYFQESSLTKNNVLDASENGSLCFDLINNGPGTAYSMQVILTEKKSVGGIIYKPIFDTGDLQANQKKRIKIPIQASSNIKTGVAVFQLQIKEGNGFDSDPFEIILNTQKFLEPDLTLSDFTFSSISGKGIIPGNASYLDIIVQNRGQGIAKDVVIEFENENKNLFFVSEKEVFHIKSMKPNEAQSFKLEFLINKRYKDDIIPIRVKSYESYSSSGFDTTLTTNRDVIVSTTNSFVQSGYLTEDVEINNVYLTSDVDRDIPLVARTHKHRYALIIGNEDYRKYQTRLQNDQNVAFARNDARTFKEYCQKILGVQDDHIFMITDATKGMMSREIERVVKLAALDSQSELIFYYAGHGLPDQVSREGYLIPVDVTSSNLEDAISLKELYSKLASTNASKIYVFLDACFSGGGRGETGLLAARTVKVKPKGDIVEGNIIAFTASNGEEVSLPLNSESHGLFTYFLLKKLKESKGEVSLGQLKTYLQEKVPRKSLIENGMGQTPQVLVSPDLSEEWANWHFQ